MAALNCVVVTPEETALEAKAEFIALPLYDGEVGIGENHSPMIGRLGYGEMRLRTGGKVDRYYVDGGFVQVADNIVSVLTNRAVPASDVDQDVARKQLDSAQKQVATTDEQLEKRERDVAQARAMLRAANRAR
jgi:F-type H+-transporting ATPase subunit epsilon